MLYEDEDDFLVGSPKSKFFDVILHANKTAVENAMTKCIERHVAMEYLLEKLAEEHNIDLENEILMFKIDKQDEMLNRKNDFFIATVGDVLVQE